MASIGETSLKTLLSSLTLSLHPSTFVFLTFPPLATPPPNLYQHMLFRESEGVTIITTLESASKHSITDYTFSSRMITCEIHSSLEAVGFMARMTSVLAERGIGCNPVSGFYHDYLFVPVEKEAEAIRALEGMVAEAKAEEGPEKER